MSIYLKTEAPEDQPPEDPCLHIGRLIIPQQDQKWDFQMKYSPWQEQKALKILNILNPDIQRNIDKPSHITNLLITL